MCPYYKDECKGVEQNVWHRCHLYYGRCKLKIVLSSSGLLSELSFFILALRGCLAWFSTLSPLVPVGRGGLRVWSRRFPFPSVQKNGRGRVVRPYQMFLLHLRARYTAPALNCSAVSPRSDPSCMEGVRLHLQVWPITLNVQSHMPSIVFKVRKVEFCSDSGANLLWKVTKTTEGVEEIAHNGAEHARTCCRALSLSLSLALTLLRRRRGSRAEKIKTTPESDKAEDELVGWEK